jgi:hypothetical protein
VAERGLPNERAWERSEVLEPRAAGRQPELISDGGGLPFVPSALDGPAAPLDPEDPAVAAMVAHLGSRRAPKTSRGLFKRGPAAPPRPPPSLAGWRLLARSDDEALFGRGRPPKLVTIAIRRDARRDTWSCYGESIERPLRASRDRIRASSWRLDPTTECKPTDTLLRILIKEQTFAGGQRASGRVLVPDLYQGADELVLTIFVTPLPGFKARSPNPETPVRVALPAQVGERQLIDGALYDIE